MKAQTSFANRRELTAISRRINSETVGVSRHVLEKLRTRQRALQCCIIKAPESKKAAMLSLQSSS